MLSVPAGLAGCSGDVPAPPPAPGGWPLVFEVPAVLGYVAARVEGGLGAGLGQLGWTPEGLDPGRPGVLLLLDSSVLGAPLALLLPVRDPAACERSLGASPLVEPLDQDGLFRLSLAPEHPLRRLALILRGGPALRSLGDLMSLLDDSAPLSFTLRLEFREDYALVVPSFEAALVARQVLGLLPLDTAGPGELRAALDLERCRDTFHSELEASSGQLRGLLTGAGRAGLMGLLSGAAGASMGNRLPVSGDFLWTLWQMLSLDDLGALGLCLRGWRMADGRPARAPGEPIRIRLAASWIRPSALTELLATLRPAPELDEGFALCAEPRAFVSAATAFCEPLGPLVKGEGEPARRWVDRLGQLLSPWSGRVELRARPEALLLALGEQPEQRFDGAGWGLWLDELMDAAGVDPATGAADLLGLHGASALHAGGALVVFPADADPELLSDAIETLFASPPPASGPVLRARLRGAELDLDPVGLGVTCSLQFPAWEGG